MVKNLLANVEDARDVGSIPGLGRSPGVGNDNPLQYSCLENPMARGAWGATVCRGKGLDTTEVKQASRRWRQLTVHHPDSRIPSNSGSSTVRASVLTMGYRTAINKQELLSKMDESHK